MRGLYIVHKIIQKSFRALFHKILSLDGWVCHVIMEEPWRRAGGPYDFVGLYDL